MQRLGGEGRRAPPPPARAARRRCRSCASIRRSGRANAHWKLDAIDAYAGRAPAGVDRRRVQRACHEWAGERRADAARRDRARARAHLARGELLPAGRGRSAGVSVTGDRRSSRRRLRRPPAPTRARRRERAAARSRRGRGTSIAGSGPVALAVGRTCASVCSTTSCPRAHTMRACEHGRARDRRLGRRDGAIAASVPTATARARPAPMPAPALRPHSGAAGRSGRAAQRRASRTRRGRGRRKLGRIVSSSDVGRSPGQSWCPRRDGRRCAAATRARAAGKRL